MKRLLLFLVLFAAASTACKKPKKATTPVTAETLIGNWTDEYPGLSSSMLPNTYSFKTDRSYTRFYGSTTEQGVYHLAFTGTTASIMSITMIPANGSSVSFNARIELTSRDRFVIYYNGSTAGRPFLRVP